MILTRKYDLDVVPGGLPLIIRASRNDSSSRLVFSLFAGEGTLSVPNGAAASFHGGDVDGAASLSFENGIPKVTVDLTREMTGSIGCFPFEIAVSSGGSVLVSPTIILTVR
ncbi:MAG: hypothetical protein IJT77_11995 [Clostridia bacterium]|nr:hypothetical protein [Clostridia bacterium]